MINNYDIFFIIFFPKINPHIIIKNPGENAKFYIQLTNSDAVLNFGELSNLVSTDLNSKIFYSISSTVQMNNFYIQNNQTFDDGTFRIFNSRFIANNLTFENNQIDQVIHLGAQAGVRHSISNPQLYIDTNITGFLNILENSKNYKIENIIYASSSSIYGINDKMPFSENDKTEKQISMYGVSKKTNELMAHAYSNLYGLKTTGLRFFTVYGPWGRPDMSPHIFTASILNNEKIKLFNNGEHTRSFTYIDDIIESIYRLIDSDELQLKKYLLLNIGGGDSIQLMDYIKLIEKSLSKQAKYDFLPRCYAEMEKTSASTNQLFDLTGYAPKIKIKEGIPRFVKWYLEYYNMY